MEGFLGDALFFSLLHVLVTIFMFLCAAGTHRHPDAPADDAFIHRLRVGNGSSASWGCRSWHVSCLSLPSPGQRGRGPDKPAQQRVGVRNRNLF